ncbi:unnamed protein product, partial [Symbiodinium natans]
DLSTTLPSSRTIPCSLANEEDISDSNCQDEDLESLQLLRGLCQRGEVGEAIQLFEKLEKQANQDGNRKLLSRLHHDTSLESLREVCKRRSGFIQRLVEPAWKEHSEWTYLNLSDPE